jgi:hypothetical protein
MPKILILITLIRKEKKYMPLLQIQVKTSVKFGGKIQTGIKIETLIQIGINPQHCL